MKNKKAVSFELMVTLIAMLGVFIVLFIITIRGLGEEKISGQESVCTLSAWANCLAEEATFGTQAYDLKCPADLVTIKMSDLEVDAELVAAEKRMRALAIEFPDLKGKNRYVTDTPTEDLKKEYVLNKIFAKHMKQCWDNFKGIPCLFSRWWLPFGCAENEVCDSLLDRIKGRRPAYCVICARIKFDDKILKKFTKAVDLASWMEVSEVGTSGISYSEYLKDDLNNVMYYDMPVHRQPLAIVFAKVNLDMVTLVLNKGVEIILGRDVVQDERQLIIVPLDSLNSYCTYIEG